ncbi:exodeoxyribonuclease VII small subunit [Alicyclobacillus tolerans]|uniref:Exodeoxyribonuclease 7 small subunit n=2 Tax=Alicyclobacillus tolerans TaxID=90970 RepID=A0A1M6S536_9BACL|nr:MULTISPECIES: exodeoxyribonuclease VII small subunit [Alicyclobacillus]MDP9728733.1 exodeoxyribonuclease VII small subunit [Alicyclobacillus tengchongensis]QRF23253.1 exodeoxyribonuclease VII small subunit [Alicyclobacillus sp. TC]SHK39882.1 Exodeoxyribonuclease VII small subunit [Alicyclobacillus montanus]
MNKSDLTFESAMKQLEETVRHLESGELSLADSIQRYKDAMDLVKYCREQLNEAEFQIEQLNPSGEAANSED